MAYNIDTHMTHRTRIYEFPVPWCNINWGVGGEHLDDPAAVRYLVLDRTLINDRRDRALLADLLRREFSIVSDDHGILVAKRVHPPRSLPARIRPRANASPAPLDGVTPPGPAPTG